MEVVDAEYQWSVAAMPLPGNILTCAQGSPQVDVLLRRRKENRLP